MGQKLVVVLSGEALVSSDQSPKVIRMTKKPLVNPIKEKKLENSLGNPQKINKNPPKKKKKKKKKNTLEKT